MAASLKLKSSPVVIGGGPTGLTSAIMLARRGYSNIKVLDRLAEPAHPDDTSIWGNFDRERSYNIGISGRGQNTLRQFGLMDVKVGLVVNVDDISLNDDEKAIFVEMAGPRFNQGKREVRLTAEKFANRLENKKYATLVLEKLLAECRTLAKLPDKYL